MDDTAKGWTGYFDRLRDSPAHRAQAAHYVGALTAQIGLSPTHRVLDFGCGFGTATSLVAPLVREVWWWDPSPAMRASTGRATASHDNARFCDLSDPHGETPAFDLILVNSVAQYMAPGELDRWLARWRGLLVRDGAIVLSDLIAPDHLGSSDVVDMLRFGIRLGSPIRVTREALGGIRSYRRMTRDDPLERIGVPDLMRRASEAGLDVAVLPRNLTHLSHRWTAVLRIAEPLRS